MSEQARAHAEETKTSLIRIQEFDPSSIGRRDELGATLNFESAVEPLKRTVALFREISPEVLVDMSQKRREAVKQQADALFNQLEQIRNFSTESASPKQARDTIIQQFDETYDRCFEQLWPAIAYSVRRATDVSRMELEARAAMQSISDRTAEIEATLKARQEEADAVLAAIRKVAAEQGVSQQAIYFKNEADEHANEANTWLTRTVWLTGGLGVYAALTLFLHKIPGIAPANAADAIQFGIGKTLLFATIAYFLILSARNYMAHRHNAIVNKHRQNSLVTYTALVEAAGDQANRDIVLAKAADSIFGAQSTGFSKHEGDEGKAFSMVNVGAGALKGAGGGNG